MYRQHLYKGSPRCSGGFKKHGKQSIGRSKGGLTTKIHLASASAKFALAFHLSPGNNHDAPEGRVLLESILSVDEHYLLMDRAYEDNQTRELAERN